MHAYLPEVLERLRLHAVKGEDAALVEGGQVAGQVPGRGTTLRQHRLQSCCEYGTTRPIPSFAYTRFGAYVRTTPALNRVFVHERIGHVVQGGPSRLGPGLG